MPFPWFDKQSKSAPDGGLSVRVGDVAYDLVVEGGTPRLAGGARPDPQTLRLFPWGFVVTASKEPKIAGNGRRWFDLVLMEPSADDEISYVFEFKEPAGEPHKEPAASPDRGGLHVGTIEAQSHVLELDDDVLREKLGRRAGPR